MVAATAQTVVEMHPGLSNCDRNKVQLKSYNLDFSTCIRQPILDDIGKTAFIKIVRKKIITSGSNCS